MSKGKFLKIFKGRRMIYGYLYSIAGPREKKTTRREKMNATSEAQRRINEDCRVRHLALLIDTNFVGEDYSAVFTFNDANLPANREGAIACYKAFVRKLRRQRVRRGEDLKYIYAVGIGDKNGRLHLHVILSGSGRGKDFDSAEIQSLWTFGFVEMGQLKNKYPIKVRGSSDANEINKLAGYLLGQNDPERKVGQQAYVCSKNLVEEQVIGIRVDSNAQIEDFMTPDFVPTTPTEKHSIGAGEWASCVGVIGDGWILRGNAQWEREEQKPKKPRRKPRGKNDKLHPPPLRE